MNKIYSNKEAAKLMDKAFIDDFTSLKEETNVDWNKNASCEYFSSGCNAAWLNQILYFNEKENEDESKILKIIDYFQKRNLNAEWRISTISKYNKKQHEILSLKGFKKEATPVMLLNIESFKEDRKNSEMEILPLPIEKVDEWVNTFSICFELNSHDRKFFNEYWKKVVLANNNFDNYMGIVDEKIVSCGSISLNGDIPVIYSIGTLPNYQKRGFGREITTHCVNQAIKKNYHQVGLFSSEDGYPVYQKLGFVEIDSIDSYFICKT